MTSACPREVVGFQILTEGGLEEGLIGVASIQAGE